MMGRWIRGGLLCPAAAAAFASTSVAGAAMRQRGPAQAPELTPCHRSTVVPAVAKAAHVEKARITVTKSIASNGMPDCRFAPRARRAAVAVTVNVDDGPQAFFRLSRAVEEASQIFGPPPPGWHAPIGLRGLGPEASWFPELGSLMAISANKVDLLTVHVRWPQAGQKARIGLARQVVIPFADRAGGSTTDKSPDFPG